MEARLAEQSATRLTVSSPTLDGSRDTLTFNLTNDGQTRLADYARVDLIVTYYTSPTARQTVWLPYESGAPAPGTWRIISITNDTYEPGILNPGETAQVSVELSPAVEAGKTNLIVIATDTGSNLTYPFGS
jgi:archaellum component FlaF (FlaF/FlaG flagellin family)